MSVTKKDLVTNLAKSSQITTAKGFSLLESFLSIIKSESKTKSVKFPTFGTFSFKKTPKRFGRNPKTLDSYIIPSINKLNFKPSDRLKDNINWKKYYCQLC